MPEQRFSRLVPSEDRLVLLCAPDEVTKLGELLEGLGLALVSQSVGEACAALRNGTSPAILISADCISPTRLKQICRAIDAAGDSSPPILLLVERASLDKADELFEVGKVIIVERPLDRATLRRGVELACQSRWRQRRAAAIASELAVAEKHHKHRIETLEAIHMRQIADLEALSIKLSDEIEERKRTEEALRESEQLFRYTVELSRQVVWSMRPGGVLVTAGTRIHELTGSPPDAYLADVVREHIHPDDIEAGAPGWKAAMRAGRPASAEFRLRGCNGTYHSFISRAVPRFDDKGEIVHWYGFIEDVTEHKMAIEALRESEDLYRGIVELSQQVVWTSELGSPGMPSSSRLSELTGLPPHSSMKDILVSTMHPDDRQRIWMDWEEANATGRPLDQEFRLRLLDGLYHTFASRAVLRFDEHGNIRHWYGFIEDVTEHRRATEALRQAEERYRLAARATNDAIWDWNLETGQIAWSDAAAAYLGNAPLEHSSIEWWENAIHPDDRERVMRSVARTLETDKARWSAAYRLRRADGGYAYVYDRGFFIRNAEGRAVRAVGAIVDLTERRRAESELRRTQAELIHISRVSAMGAMASTLAHELNQPLTAVTSYVRGSRRLLAGFDDPAIRQVGDALEFAEAGALRAGQIVRRLRELVARGAVEVRPENLVTLVEDASVLAFVDEHLHGIIHEIRIDPDARWVEADRIQIQQVLINLIRNALQALQNSDTRHVAIAARSAGEDMVEVSVADTGGGIPPSVREALFSPFHSTKSEGMGIGLSISRTIVEAHHGRIWAEDLPEGGTIFRFTLPKADVAEDVADSAEADRGQRHVV